MFRHHVLVQNNSHTSLFSIIITIRSLSVTQKNTILTMINAGHSAHSIVSTIDTHTSVISRYHFKSVLGFRSSLVINYSKVSLAIPGMSFTLLPFGRQKILFG